MVFTPRNRHSSQKTYNKKEKKTIKKKTNKEKIREHVPPPPPPPKKKKKKKKNITMKLKDLPDIAKALNAAPTHNRMKAVQWSSMKAMASVHAP